MAAEANFLPHDDYQRVKLSALAEHPVEVYCQCDPQLAARRYNDRARTCHPIHVVASIPRTPARNMTSRSASGN